MKSILRCSCLYFVMVFSAGFLLGTIRVLFMEPYFGEQNAELMEMPVMVLVSFLSARFVIRRAARDMGALEMVAVGLFALAYLLLLEFSMVVWLRNLSLSDYVQSRYSIAGVAYVASLILYALFPLLVYKTTTSHSQPS